jgi:hypothetical protein
MISFFLASAYCLPSSAHSVSVAPVHVSGRHDSYSGHGGGRGFWATLFGFNVQTEAPLTGAYGVAMPYDYAVAPPAIHSDAERYRTATGLALPPRHGVIVVPSATPKGDVTYIWPNTRTD